MYALGMTALTNPYSAITFALLSQLAVSQAAHTGFKQIL
jgi:hypothetical protein